DQINLRKLRLRIVNFINSC
ncbi:unnamed protein product, partial [Allacma fusca]